jgi:perosamine synthetase
MLEKLICNIDKTLIDAWKIINENGKGIVLITDAENKLFGVLTDGDIRRFLIVGGKLEEKIQTIMNVNFIRSTENESTAERIKKAKSVDMIIPIVDDSLKLVNYFEYRTNIFIPIASPDLKGNEFSYLMDAFLSTWISSSGAYIQKFENSFVDYCNVNYGVAVSNGTVALHLALLALKVGKGDEVIVPDLTFAATINTVLHANATPVIVDVERDSWCIDPIEIEKAITKKTKAIIPVHLYGQPCDMDSIMDIAKRNKLFVIEDCAEAHGAIYKEKKVGSFGDIGCFSFFGNKVLTTGEGGMCITNNNELNDRMRVLRDHGMSKTKRYWHEEVGYNYRMTNLQASIGLAQLERIDEILENRKVIEEKYKSKLSLLSHVEFQRDNLPSRQKITWMVCALLGNERDDLIEVAQKEGVDLRPFFYSLSMMPIYEKYVFSNKVSLNLSKSGINFPTNSSLDSSGLNHIIEMFTKYYN